jgi:diguanylate cyclase (GGDEF)-like protein
VRQDERFIHASVSDVRSELAVPLTVGDRVIGAINVESSAVAAFSEADVRLLTATAAHLGQTIQVARLHDQFKHLATTDALTGLANHRAFYVRLEEEIRHVNATGGQISVAIMDLDNLKLVNDTYGHLAGDDMLRAMADGLRDLCRRSDFVARYGGDEFAFILADTDRAGAERAVSNLIAGLAQRLVVIDGHNTPLSTGAWGIAAFPEDGVRPAELVRVADQRMYANKRFSKSLHHGIETTAAAVGTRV